MLGSGTVSVLVVASKVKVVVGLPFTVTLPGTKVTPAGSGSRICTAVAASSPTLVTSSR